MLGTGLQDAIQSGRRHVICADGQHGDSLVYQLQIDDEGHAGNGVGAVEHDSGVLAVCQEDGHPRISQKHARHGVRGKEALQYLLRVAFVAVWRR